MYELEYVKGNVSMIVYVGELDEAMTEACKMTQDGGKASIIDLESGEVLYVYIEGILVFNHKKGVIYGGLLK